MSSAISPEYTIRYSSRARRIRIRVTSAGCEVVLPKGVPSSWGHAFARRKRDWIRRTIQKQALLLENFREQGVEEGDLVQYEGRWVPIRIFEPGQGPKVLKADEEIHLCVKEVESRRTELNKWLADSTLAKAKELSPKYEEIIGVKPRKILLGRNKRAWGSCGNSGIVRIHWRLIQAPPEVLEYVLVHELAHLIHPNHQAPFWKEVSRALPQYREFQVALKIWERGPRTI